MKTLARLLFLMALPAGTVFCFGCSSVGGKSIETTVNPEFDILSYHRVYIDCGDEASFLSMDIYKVFEIFGVEYINNSEYLKSHDSHDLYVIVTADKGVTLPPTPTRGGQGPLFVQPKIATVEIQDAMTKKQLLLCTYRRGFLGTASYGECREMLVNELTQIFNELKAKGKSPTPSQPDNRK
ncbi:MAG: hypothetical protein WAX69_14855 [Victivallales bacterium]